MSAKPHFWSPWYLLVLLWGCGVDERAAVSYVAVVPVVDEYLDLYGPIELTVEGYEAVANLEQFEQFSCDDPAFLIDKRDIDLGLELFAYSERHHVWRETLPDTYNGECITVSLGYENVWSGMTAIGYKLEERCYPLEVFISIGGEEMKYLGSIFAPWNGDTEDRSRAERARVFLEAMRDGKAVAYGSGTGTVHMSWKDFDQCSEGEGSWEGDSGPIGALNHLLISYEYSN